MFVCTSQFDETENSGKNGYRFRMSVLGFVPRGRDHKQKDARRDVDIIGSLPVAKTGLFPREFKLLLAK